MSWAINRRLDWIDDRLNDGGTFVRADVAAYFGVSQAQITNDINLFRQIDPAMVYDASAKCFRRNSIFDRSVRNSTAARRAAWEAF